MPLDSLSDVRVFRQVVSSGGMSAAARALGMTRNRVSQRFSALEKALGTKLAHRDTRTLALTEEGERFHEQTAAVMEAAERAESSVGAAQQIEGRVRIAVRSSLTGRGLGAEFARLLHSAPKLRLQIVVNDEPLTLLDHGFDLAIHVGALRDSALVATRLEISSWVMAATPGYLDAHGRPRRPADLAAHSCIRKLGPRPESSWQLIDGRGHRVEAPLGGQFECSDAQLQVEALHAGLGIGLRPRDEVDRLQATGTLERVLPSWSFVPFSVWLVSSPGRMKLPRVAAVADLLKRIIGKMDAR